MELSYDLIYAQDAHMMEGLIIKGLEDNEEIFAAYEGTTIAHDLVHHVNGFEKIGCPSDELEAVGAFYWINSGYEETNIVSDIYSIVGDHADSLVGPPLPQKHCDEYYIFEDAIQQVDLDVPPEVFHLLCSGYLKAEAKYSSTLEAYKLYLNIKNICEEILQNDLQLSLGSEYRITVSPYDTPTYVRINDDEEEEDIKLEFQEGENVGENTQPPVDLDFPDRMVRVGIESKST